MAATEEVTTLFELETDDMTASSRRQRGRSTLTAAYQQKMTNRGALVKGGSDHAPSASADFSSSADILRMNTMRTSESRGDMRADTETSQGGTQTEPTAKAVSVMPSTVPQHIKLDMTTLQLLQIKGEDLPPSDTDFQLALKKAGERLELIVNPVPDAQSLGSASVFHMLGKEGSKQPSILYGSVGYIIDYLIAPHVGAQKLGLASYIPAQLRRPSMNVAARTDTGRSVVIERMPDWVLRLWDAFLLTYKDACTTEDLVKELVSRFHKTTQRKPGLSERPVSQSITSLSFVQTSFETTNNHVVVARRALDDEGILSAESLTSRSARAVLSWMGLLDENRSSTAIRTNTLLLILHWLRSCSGPLDLAADRAAFDRLHECATSAAGLDDIDLAGFAKFILKDMRVISEVCAFDRKKVEYSFGLDFDGSTSRQNADSDQFRLREMSLCYAARPLPHWIFKAKSVFKRSPESVAAELTLMTYDFCYRHVHPVMLTSDKVRHASMPVQDMIRWFRVLSYWPLTWLFEEGIKMTVRLQRLNFFLSVAEHLRKMSNFHTLFAVMAGITQPYAAWLWSSVPHSDKNHKRFDDLKRAVSSYGDYRVYKADLSHCHGRSRIPFLGVTSRLLSALESDHTHSTNHPNLYHFARQVARNATINEFIGGHRHPYTSKSGYSYAVSAGPPGPSPFQLHPEGVVVGSRYAQYPPSTAWNGVYSQAKLSAGGDIDRHFGVVPQVTTPPSFEGSVELPHDEELRLLLSWQLSNTLTEEAVKELSVEARNQQDEVVVHSLEAAGFL